MQGLCFCFLVTFNWILLLILRKQHIVSLPPWHKDSPLVTSQTFFVPSVILCTPPLCLSASQWVSMCCDPRDWQNYRRGSFVFFCFFTNLSFKTSRKKSMNSSPQGIWNLFKYSSSSTFLWSLTQFSRHSFIRRKTRELWPARKLGEGKEKQESPGKIGNGGKQSSHRGLKVLLLYQSALSLLKCSWTRHYKGEEKPSISPTGGNRLSHYYWDNSRVKGRDSISYPCFSCCRTAGTGPRNAIWCHHIKQ